MLLAIGCGDSGSPASRTGGTGGTGGDTPAATGGTRSTGGVPGSGGSSTGGAPGSGGAGVAGAQGTGGVAGRGGAAGAGTGGSSGGSGAIPTCQSLGWTFTASTACDVTDPNTGGLRQLAYGKYWCFQGCVNQNDHYYATQNCTDTRIDPGADSICVLDCSICQ